MATPRNGRTGPLPMPADFAERSRGMTDKERQRIWPVSLWVLNCWKRDAGMLRPYRRPELPREEVQRLTDTMSQIGAAAKLGITTATWRKMQGVAGVQRGVAA